MADEETVQTEQPTEQTAVAETKEAPTEATPAAEGAAQPDVLDDLLKEFDLKREAAQPQQQQPAPSGPMGEQQPIDVAALATIERRLAEQEARETRRELENLFGRLSDGTQADAVDAEAYCNAMALRDPRINQAWMQRTSNPRAWGKVETALRQDFTKRYGKKVDKQVTESRDAVASAVRSASTAAPQKEMTDKEIYTASKDEFDALQRKLGVTPV